MYIKKTSGKQFSLLPQNVTISLPGILNPASVLAPLSSQARFPDACGGVSEHLWDNKWIEDFSRFAARSFNYGIVIFANPELIFRMLF